MLVFSSRVITQTDPHTPNKAAGSLSLTYMRYWGHLRVQDENVNVKQPDSFSLITQNRGESHIN